MVEISTNIDDQPIMGKKREEMPWEHEGDLVDPELDQSNDRPVLPPEKQRDHGNGPISSGTSNGPKF